MIPHPSSVVPEAAQYLTSPEFLADMIYSWARIMIGFSLAVVLGLGFGLVAGYGGFASEVALRIGDLFRPIPAISFLPVVSLMFSNVDLGILTVLVIGGVFPVFVSVSSGLRDPASVSLIRVGQSFCGTKRLIFFRIKLPLAIKALVIGIRTSAGTVFTVLVTAEMLSGKGGLGYRVWESYTLLNYQKVLVGMLLIGVSGYVLNALADRLFKKIFGGHYVDQ